MRQASSLSTIPMDSSAADGVFSNLRDIFSSTNNNYYYAQIQPSQSYIELSQAQTNCKLYSRGNSIDTLYAPKYNEDNSLYVGDLRLVAVYTTREFNNTLAGYASTFQSYAKFTSVSQYITLYRASQLYLRYAEALNRAGFPQAAFCVLKYGMTNVNINQRVSAEERANSGTLISFSQYDFTAQNTTGIHSLGSGTVSADTLYVIPELPTATDSIDYIENLIVDEMALETALEGNRLYDLIRIALRRNDPSYLATKIANRGGDGTYNSALYQKLLSPNNWYLPLK